MPRYDRRGAPRGLTILLAVMGLLAIILGVGLVAMDPGFAFEVYEAAPYDEAPFGPGSELAAAAILVAVGVLLWVAAWAVSTEQPWAWSLSVGLAIVSLLVPPILTLLGVITLLYLGQRDVRKRLGAPV